MRILLCEDEVELSSALTAILKHNQYGVDAVYDGQEALDYLDSDNYDAVILDIMMPKIDGIEVLKTMRRGGNNTPVLMLTAKTQIDDKVLGLDSGANDYLTKPFETRELLARLRVMTRGGGNEGGTSLLAVGNLTLNRATFALKSPTGEFRLANKEFQMMEMLMMGGAQLISSERFMEKVWGYDSESELNVVWVYISYLRKKLTALGADVQIKATRNTGYSLEAK